MGYDFTGGRNFDFPIDFCMGFKTVQRACDYKVELTGIGNRSQINADDNIVTYGNCTLALLIFRLHKLSGVRRGATREVLAPVGSVEKINRNNTSVFRAT